MKYGLFSLIMAGTLLLSSCRGVPTGFIMNENFNMDDEVLASLNDYFHRLDTSCYYMQKSDCSGEPTVYIMDIYVDEKNVIWFESRDNRIAAYQNGIMYTRDEQTDELIQEEATFDLDSIKEEIDFSHLLLESILSGEANDFSVEHAGTAIVAPKEIHVTLSFHGDLENETTLMAAMPEFSTEGITLEMNYLKETNEFSSLLIQWHTDKNSYMVEFDSTDYLEQVRDAIESIKN